MVGSGGSSVVGDPTKFALSVKVWLSGDTCLRSIVRVTGLGGSASSNPWNVNSPSLNSCVGTTAGLVRAVRKRWSSWLKKKNVLFFQTGPPIEYPNWLRA